MHHAALLLCLHYDGSAEGKNDNKVMSIKLSSLEELRRNEKPYYDFVIETWQKSRRLRHDQKHLVLMLNQLYEEKV